MKYLTNGAPLLQHNTPKVITQDIKGSKSTTYGKPGVKWWDCSSGFQHMQSLPSRAKYWGTFNMMALVWFLAAAGVGVALIVYQFFSRQNYQHYVDVLANMCDERARMLQHQFAVSMNHVHALAILVSTFYVGMHPSALNQDIFAEYTARTAFERPLMTGVAYAHRVFDHERGLFEKEQGWTIKSMHSKMPSPVHDEYAPTIFSQETIGYLVSLDMMSGEEDCDNILRARASGKGVLTGPFRLLKSNHLGVVLTFAVYKKELPPDASAEEKIDAAVGYLGGAFDFESLVDNLLLQLSKNGDILVNVYDITNFSRPLIMYGTENSDDGLFHVSPLDFGDPFRRHEMRCRLARKVPRPTLAFGFATGVLAFVTLICAMVYNAHKHVKKVEEDYRKMEELKVQAEAADIAKSQFLATVSHEIRTPMNGVLGMLQMLLNTQLDATQQDFATTAQASGKALVTLINEVLDQAKIESGRIELEAVPFDLRAILDDILSLFCGKTRGEGIELAAYVSERVPFTLIGDPGRIRQIITNLVGNSVKFTEKGHIFVCVHLWEDMDAVLQLSPETIPKQCARSFKHNNTLSGYAVANQWSCWDLLLAKERERSTRSELSEEIKLFISVEDTGVGIPSQAQQRIFMPFMQADSSTSRTYGGTGIGLSISRCLVELMKGEMHFESQEGVGSTFSCSLVLRRGDDASLGEDKHTLSDRVLLSKFKDMSALIVDGALVRSEVTRYHLQRLGLQVRIVSDLDVALEYLIPNSHVYTRKADDTSILNGKFDLVLVEKDAWGYSSGLNFPSFLRTERHGGKSIICPKLILIATSMTSAECEIAKLMGYADTIIMKPLRASMIAACLQQVIGMGDESQPGREETGNLQNLLCGKKILVVDDNRVNRIVAAGALKKYGAHVECADSGKAAIAKLEPPHTFDACFMDIQMPEMDGFEATRNIRKLEEIAKESGKIWHVPILAMTADVIQATYDECVRCKMDGYVSKPFEEEQLYKAVSQVLSRT
ncbi:hypothetical protein KP509_12G066900 [Ceratopteris richardii]|uniref:histidine kinase n=3 Tax=Ceratopteris richardii TaxID=49495 RepID=A0A8T2TMM6_CERRI|nr:hypothetical protein KP509_12G066900 [Ceratopteris richardii]